MGLRAEKENRSLICEASRRTRPQDELWRRFVSNYRTCCRPPHLRLICFISSLKGNQCGVKDQTVSLTAAALCSINFTSCTFSLKLTSAVYRPPAVEERISSNDLQNVLCFTQSWAVVHDWQRDRGGRRGTEGGDGRRGSFSPSVGDGAEVVIYSVLLQKSNVLMEAGAPEVIHLHHLCVLVDYEDEEIKED